MPDDLRTRIAKTLYRQFGPSLGAHPDGWERETFTTQDTFMDDADAVLAAMCLERESRDDLSRPFHRYVTEWLPDQEPASDQAACVVDIRTGKRI